MIKTDSFADNIHLQNPWWQEPNYLPREDRFPKRNLFNSLYDDTLDLKQIISIVGLRRTGKSTLLKQIIAKLLIDLPPKKILYFSFDEPTVKEIPQTIENLLDYYLKEIIKQPIHKLNQKVFIFLDEIQFVPYWQDIIKRYYDLNPQLKFVVTGSSSLILNKGSRESLAGRIFEKKLDPLNFLEYQKFSHNDSFDDYLLFGGFPEMLEINDSLKRVEYLKNWIIGKIIEVDIPKLTNIRYPADLERLFWALLPNTGQMINFSKLSFDLGIKKPTLFKYLEILEKSLLLQKILNSAGSFRSQSRVIRKFYPASPNFLNLLPAPVNPGFQAEAYAAQFLVQKFSNVNLYRLRGHEVDFIVEDKRLAIEVKYQNSLHPQDYKFLTSFIQKKKYKGFLLTKDFKGNVANNQITCLPLSEIENFSF